MQIPDVPATSDLPTSIAATVALPDQQDPVHSVLRSAQNLEYLQIEPNYPSLFSQREGDRSGRRTQMFRLTSAVIPPPSIWCMDIIAPNLQRLAFSIADDSTRHNHETGYRGPPNAVSYLPTIDESPATIESLVHLTELSFECGNTDKISRLEDWLVHTTNLRKLSIHGVSGGYHAKHLSVDKDCVDAAHIGVLRLLAENPQLCPKLQELDLRYCYTPEPLLAALLVKQRADGSHVANRPTKLERLYLRGCSPVSEQMEEWLSKNIPDFSARPVLPTDVPSFW